MDSEENSKIILSVIVTCYNEGNDLLRAIQSLENQTYKDFEIIIVKDYSNHQETIEICKILEDKGYIVLWETKNVGVSATRNWGISVAQGDIVCMVDADDELPHDALEIISNYFEENPNSDVIFGNYELCQLEKNVVVDCKILCDNQGVLSPSVLFGGNLLLLGMLPMRKRLWEMVGGYNDKYAFGCQDIEMQIRIMEKGIPFHYVPFVIYKWHKKPTGINSSKRNAISFDMCCFEHLDFLSSYLSHKYVLQLCKQFNDSKLFRFYFRQYTDGIKSYLSYMPFSILRKMIRFVS